MGSEMQIHVSGGHRRGSEAHTVICHDKEELILVLL